MHCMCQILFFSRILPHPLTSVGQFRLFQQYVQMQHGVMSGKQLQHHHIKFLPFFLYFFVVYMKIHGYTVNSKKFCYNGLILLYSNSYIYYKKKEGKCLWAERYWIVKH